MKINRRNFLRAATAGAATACVPRAAHASEAAGPSDPYGMLVDTTVCIGCRKCEFACAQENNLNDKPVEAYEDTAVFEERRRPDADAFTVVNAFRNLGDPDKPTYVKQQCMHCLHPACASACLVGALEQQENGAVTYDAWKCMGCRYCMIACPFEIPAYEYDDALSPEVRKCGFCFERVAEEHKIPACAEMCPPMALTYGKRSELLELAKHKIAAEPDKYIDHIYGEHEAGGTSWLYLAARPFKELDFLPLGDKSMPAITETLQHGIFRYGAVPAMVFGLLATAQKVFTEPEDDAAEKDEHTAAQHVEEDE